MSEEKYRPLTSRLLVGRPRWKLLLEEIGKTNNQWVQLDSRINPVFLHILTPSRYGFSKRVGVFCCGPKGISRTLHRLCNSARSSDATFVFNKESFSWSSITAAFLADLWLLEILYKYKQLKEAQRNFYIHRLHFCLIFILALGLKRPSRTGS